MNYRRTTICQRIDGDGAGKGFTGRKLKVFVFYLNQIEKADICVLIKRSTTSLGLICYNHFPQIMIYGYCCVKNLNKLMLFFSVLSLLLSHSQV